MTDLHHSLGNPVKLIELSLTTLDIVTSQLKETFQRLFELKNISKSQQKLLTLLSARYYDNENNNTHGVRTADQYNIEKNKITKTLTEFVDELS